MFIDFLLDRFEEHKEKVAIISRDCYFTFEDLLASVNQLKMEFESQNISKGTVATIESDSPFIAISSLLALIDLNCIVVPFTSDSILNKKEYASIAQVMVHIKYSEDTLFYEQLHQKSDNEYYQYLRDTNHPGLILFSSGTSGKSKATVHDLSKLLIKYKTQRKNLRTLTFMLFDHIGGVDTIFYSFSNASTLVFPEDRSPETICKNIEKYNIEVLPTTPTFLNLLFISEAHKRYKLSSLKYITYGTEPMPKYTLEKLNTIFPNTTILQKYGTTEVGTLRSKSLDSNSDLVKIGGEGYKTRVIDGMLEIKADSAMLGYLNAPSPFSDDGWFLTGDEVEVKGDYYRILGRRSEIINVGGEKVFPAEVEGVIQELNFVSESIVYSEKNMIMGNIVCAKVSLTKPVENKTSIIREIKKYCKTKLQNYKIPVKIKIIDKELHSKRFKKIRTNITTQVK